MISQDRGLEDRIDGNNITATRLTLTKNMSLWERRDTTNVRLRGTRQGWPSHPPAYARAQKTNGCKSLSSISLRMDTAHTARATGLIYGR